MPVPESTTPEGFARFVGGKLLRIGQGSAWREVQARTTLLPPLMKSLHLPAVSEPFLALTLSGEAEFGEREGKGPWLTNRLTKGALFLTTGGEGYEVRWKALTDEPFVSLAVFLELPLLERVLTDVFGADAPYVRLRDVSAITDPALHLWLEQLVSELERPQASELFVQSIGQSLAIHLARHYTDLIKEPSSGSPSLPGYKLRQITGWMRAHLTEDFNLDRLAGLAGLSKFHFLRLFKRGVGATPLQYHTALRITEAKRLLRETNTSVLDVALDVGYKNPSHFAKVFRRDTGQSPADYRKLR